LAGGAEFVPQHLGFLYCFLSVVRQLGAERPDPWWNIARDAGVVIPSRTLFFFFFPPPFFFSPWGRASVGTDHDLVAVRSGSAPLVFAMEFFFFLFFLPSLPFFLLERRPGAMAIPGPRNPLFPKVSSSPPHRGSPDPSAAQGASKRLFFLLFLFFFFPFSCLLSAMSKPGVGRRPQASAPFPELPSFFLSNPLLVWKGRRLARTPPPFRLLLMGEERGFSDGPRPGQVSWAFPLATFPLGS